MERNFVKHSYSYMFRPHWVIIRLVFYNILKEVHYIALRNLNIFERSEISLPQCNLYTVWCATTNDATKKECYNEQFLSIKSGCYNERGGILSAEVAGACA